MVDKEKHLLEGKARRDSKTAERDFDRDDQINYFDNDDETSLSSLGEEETKSPRLKISVLLLLYLEKFLETVVLFLLVLVFILWGTLLLEVEEKIWPLIGLVITSFVTTTILYRVKWCRKYPGFLLFKLFYMTFLASFLIMLAVHIPRLLTFLSPYFTLIGLGSIAFTYLFFAFITATHRRLCKISSNSHHFWLLFSLVPISILFLTQPTYFVNGIWHFQNYWDFTANIITGVVLSLPFHFEACCIYNRFMNSVDIDEFFGTAKLLPGFVTSKYSNKLTKHPNAKHHV